MAASSESTFFEGTEKLLEVWFSSTKESEKPDLRTVEMSEWKKLMKLVNCEIISQAVTEDMDAYVLSESSMFVTERRFILKTCGTTTLLNAIEPLLKLVKEKCDGAAYSLGRINKDCWYLYTLDEKMKIFTKEVSKDGKEATHRSGIDKIIPGAKIDDFLFDPCGYSMNGLMPEGKYITIHVTPEPNCSYVSFESNVPQESYNELVMKVLETFNPGKVLMTIFANKESIASQSHKDLDAVLDEGQYSRVDHQFCMFKNYNLTYTYFTRPV
ncbi:DCAM-like protein [Mya arenaria]|uniref:DCAM-like protein n=1 Tax=Mya arenaria TaxID=6604 RepID=A0ABY7EAB8_MYAAR|nr:DCAM-like protein [Mya arenaria]